MYKQEKRGVEQRATLKIQKYEKRNDIQTATRAAEKSTFILVENSFPVCYILSFSLSNSCVIFSTYLFHYNRKQFNSGNKNGTVKKNEIN